MLHKLIFLIAFFGLLPSILMSAFAGILIYKWLEYLTPEGAYYFDLLPGRLSLFVGALTFACWLMRERKVFPRSALMWVLIAFFVWINLTSVFALAPTAAAFKWERTVKVIGFSVLAAQMMSTRTRVEAFVWLQVLCVGYTAVPGAIKTIVSGGGPFTVVGVPGSFIEERVAYAVILPMIMPLALFLAEHSTLLPRSRWLTVGLRGVAFSCMVALIGTFARTALFSGGAALSMLVFKSRYKLWATAITTVAVCACLFFFARESWFERMDTTMEYQQDASAANRVEAWKWSWNMALEHPITGGGFRVFALNYQRRGALGYMEAHNSFLEVLAEHGFVGVGLFCWLIIGAYRSCTAVRRRARDRPELVWTANLAAMLQISIVAFVAGSMFISVATSAFLYDIVSLAIGLRSVSRLELVNPRIPSKSRDDAVSVTGGTAPALTR